MSEGREPFERERRLPIGGRIIVGDATIDLLELEGRGVRIKVISPSAHVSFCNRSPASEENETGGTT